MTSEKSKALLVLRNIVIVVVLQVVIYSLNCLQIDYSDKNDLLPLFSIILSFLCVIIPTLAAVLIFRVTPGYLALANPVLWIISDRFHKDGTYLFADVSSSYFFNMSTTVDLFVAFMSFTLLELLLATIVWMIRRFKKRHKEKLQETQPEQSE